MTVDTDITGRLIGVLRSATEAHAGHPWLINGPTFARRLARLTGSVVRAR